MYNASHEHQSKDIKTRLQSINGQINGLIKMLDENINPEKILTTEKVTTVNGK
ncbi:metal-sensing transcriptional repressor [Salegentibacter sp. HM20]